MSQQYTPLAGGQTIKDSRQVINNNIDAVASSFSGTAFPTTNLTVGMSCYRTDERIMYRLVQVSPPQWVQVENLNGNFRHIEGGLGHAIPYGSGDLNHWAGMPTGIYEGAGMFNAPENSTDWFRVIHIRHGNSLGYSSQLAFPFHQEGLWLRRQVAGNWTAWTKVWTATTDGAGTGLDADLLDGLQASDFLRVINSSLVTVETDWNAVPVGVCAVANGGGANSPAATLGAYPYGVVLTMKAEIERGMCQIYIPHHSNGKYSMYVRAGWVGASQPWNTWRAVVTSEQLTWENITGKPNTIAGYGITDAAKKATVSTAAPSGGVDGDVWYQV